MIKITDETVNTFLNGHDPMERIISVECDYMEDMVSIIYVNERGQKMVKKDQFKPFCWAKHSACVRMFKGDRKLLARKLKEYGINVRALITAGADGKTHERVENGYKFLFFSTRKMSYNRFLNFFKEAGTPVYGSKEDRSDQTREFMTASPVEQYLIQTGKRLFKGYENYDELKRFLFDLETQGLNPEVHAIDQIGMRTNKGFERIITITGEGREREINELNAIEEFVRTIAIEKPDIIAGHNSENFDWDFLIVRCKKLGSSFEEITKKYFVHPIYKKKKEAILKLGGEMEYYYPTVAWGFNILDSLHAVRRAQALDSNMKSASLKYTTKYLNLKKPNRVYVPGDKITKTWNIMDEKFAFNNENGDWYEISNENPLKDGYEPTSGRYIVERYLLDDLYETDKVELRLNESNFLVAKILPTTFTRACTMGTAGIWKLIMLAWSYENNLAVPATSNNARFTGGLSRLLKVGFVEHIVKLDFNSLYPSIDLTWNVGTDVDITGIMLHLLEFILSGREKYKELKAVAGKKVDELKEYLENNRKSLSNDEIHKIKDDIAKWKSEKAANDKKQLPLKILANSFFGSYGSPMVFPFGDLLSAEKTTCIGRQSLRIMISHFKKIGYEPIVGDSFTGDTPLFIKYDDSGLIDIKPIEELIGDTETDVLGREYDTSVKSYKVLCRSGWVRPSYIYRHKTDKPLYEVSDDKMSVTVTEDHSLFTDKQEKIKPSEISDSTNLEYYDGKVDYSPTLHPKGFTVKCIAKWLMRGELDRIPIEILNSNKPTVKEFLSYIDEWDYSNTSKTCRAGINFLKKL